MITFSSYLKTTIIFTLLLLGATASFNLIIDPFGLFHLLDEEKNVSKPEFYKHLRMTKAHNVRLFKPDGIVLGTSRAEFGIDPGHSGWTAKKRYNLALSSANIYEVYRYLQHAQTINPLKEVVIGLDFFMFNANKAVEKDFSESRLKSPSSLLSTGWYHDLFQSLLTYDALTASWATLQAHSDKATIRYLKNGFRNDSNNWLRITESKGHRNAALKSERYTLIAQDGYPFFDFNTSLGRQSPFQTFKNLLIFCKNNNIDLKLFISPTHARTLEIIHLIGLWNDFERWKKTLVSNIDEISPNTLLWDFSGFNTITTEPFPPLNNSKDQMKWYWESSHYKKEVGNMILDKLFSVFSGEPAPRDFGIRLSPENINKHLKTAESERKQYEQIFPDEITELKGLIKETEKKRQELYAKHPEMQLFQAF